MIKSTNIILSNRASYNTDYQYTFNKLSYEFQPVLDFIEQMTDVNNKKSSPMIIVDFSPEVKHKYSVSWEEIRKAVGDMFDGIDESGEVPPDYDWYRRDWEERKDCEEPECRSDDNFYEHLRGRILDGWLRWADEIGRPDLKRKMRKFIGKMRAMDILVSVEYFSTTKTIVFYENVLGEISNPSRYEDWLVALACGLFYAWYYDCGGKKVKDYVIEGLCTDLIIHYTEDKLSKSNWWLRDLFYCDMFDIPEASVQYMENIELKGIRGDYIIFRRLFKMAMKKAVYAETYIRMAYGLYEGLSMEDVPKGLGRDNTQYIFNRKSYGKGPLCLAIVKQYVADHPAITSDLLKDVFDNSLQGTRTIETVSEACARIAKSKDKHKNKRAFMDPGEVVSTTDEDCVVSTEWGLDNIDRMIDKAKALGYKVKKVE